jgi:ankyrin repeat protein
MQKRKYKVSKKLLHEGADINFRDLYRKGNTALHFAVKKNDLQIVTFILTRGVDIHIKNDC